MKDNILKFGVLPKYIDNKNSQHNRKENRI